MPADDLVPLGARTAMAKFGSRIVFKSLSIVMCVCIRHTSHAIISLCSLSLSVRRFPIIWFVFPKDFVDITCNICHISMCLFLSIFTHSKDLYGSTYIFTLVFHMVQSPFKVFAFSLELCIRWEGWHKFTVTYPEIIYLPCAPTEI